VCSAIHPLGAGSPFFRRLPLDHFGLEWIDPPVLAAHPLDDGRASSLYHDLDRTANRLGSDGSSYRKLIEPLAERTDRLMEGLLSPLFPSIPSIPMMRFGAYGAWPSITLARRRFETVEGRALFAGMAAHSILPLEQLGTSAFALTLLVAGHAYGWPLPRGGSQSIANALAGYFKWLGGEIATGTEVRRFSELPNAGVYLFDTTPSQLLEIAGDRIVGLYRKQIQHFRHGPGTFKIDFALSQSIPWEAEECRRAGTVHVGGTLEEVAAAERAVGAGLHPDKPFVLVTQPSLFDDTRAGNRQHTAWAYCHVPHGSTVDMTGPIERQIERFAPGFAATIAARHTMNSAEMEIYNPNYVGGDISGGGNQLRQLVARPSFGRDPYATSDPRIFLCSASTPPGGGVHGMAGYHAARSALKRLWAT
jgi:phytoene dehydrogenase-like protein